MCVLGRRWSALKGRPSPQGYCPLAKYHLSQSSKLSKKSMNLWESLWSVLHWRWDYFVDMSWCLQLLHDFGVTPGSGSEFLAGKRNYTWWKKWLCSSLRATPDLIICLTGYQPRQLSCLYHHLNSLGRIQFSMSTLYKFSKMYQRLPKDANWIPLWRCDMYVKMLICCRCYLWHS